MLGGVPGQILGRRCKPSGIFFEHPDRGIATVAKQTANLSRVVVVIHAKKLHEPSVVTRSFRGHAILPWSAANRTATVLLLQEVFQLLH
jgi:hypothetical protein